MTSILGAIAFLFVGFYLCLSALHRSFHQSSLGVKISIFLFGKILGGRRAVALAYYVKIVIGFALIGFGVTFLFR